MSVDTLRRPPQLDISLLKESVANIQKEPRPLFEKGGVPYYAEIPSAPREKPRQTILSLGDETVKRWVEAAYAHQHETQVDKKKRVIDWRHNPSGITNPGFGSYDHGVIVEFDKEGIVTKALHDTVIWNDGPLDEKTGLATSGTVIIPIEKVGDEYYVHCFWQYRSAPYDSTIKVPKDMTDPKQIRDFIALNRGMWMLTTPGGFADFASETPEAVAKREALQEAGLRIHKPTLTQQSFNRANIGNLVNVGFCTFERKTDRKLSKDAEIILGKMAIRIDKFQTNDAIVGAAVSFAREQLGLTSASPVKSK